MEYFVEKGAHNERIKNHKLIPAFKDYIWGGNRLVNEYNKKCDMERVAESWEISTHKDDESIVEYGIFKGLTLSEYIRKNQLLLYNSQKWNLTRKYLGE